jgi:hypothetical protein
MLKSIFEAAIDTLRIPEEMKTAIKDISNICLEAEGDEKDPARQRNQPQTMDFNNPSSYNVFPPQSAPAAQPAKQQSRQPQVPKGATRAPSQVRTSGPAPQGQPQAQPQQQAPQQAQPQVPKGMTREPNQVRTSGPAANGQEQVQAQQQAQPQPHAQKQQQAPQQQQQQAQPQQQPQLRKGADVATVQYFLNSRNPNLKLAADGVLGPNTIKAIQATENINATGKMDNATNEAFNLLLNEAKKKVQAAQSKLGVSQDGLIGKQTLAALNNANMNVNSIFTGMPAAEKNATQNAKVNTQQPQANAQQQTNLIANKFDEARAQQALKSNYISQQEYNIWKTYGIAPVYQRQKPQETQAYIAKMQQAKNGQPQQSQASNVMTTNGPRNDAEKKFFEQTKANYEKIYTQTMSDKDLALQKADQAARVALAKKQKGEWAKEGQAALDNVIANMGNNNQTQNATQPQQQAPQKPQAQPQQQTQQQQNPKAPQGSTQYMSGKVSYMNLPPDEKKVYDDAEKKAQAEYLKKGNNEQTAYEKAQMNAQVAVLRYRQKKGNKS